MRWAAAKTGAFAERVATIKQVECYQREQHRPVHGHRVTLQELGRRLRPQILTNGWF